MNENRHILICGCGGVGGWLAAALSRIAPVTVYDVNRSVVRHIKRYKLTIEDVDSTRRIYAVNAVSEAAELKELVFDMAIIAVKSYDTVVAVRDIGKYCRPRVLVSMQNGLENVEVIAKYFPDASIVWGIVDCAVHMFRQGCVKVFLNDDIYVGAYAGKYSDAVSIQKILHSAGFHVRVIADPVCAAWAKLIFNAVMNPITILAGRGYSCIQEDRLIYSFVCSAIDEGVRVAEKSGIRLFFDPMRRVRDLRKSAYADFLYKGSMYYDYQRGVKTEIDFLTGYLVRCAKRLKLPTPFLDEIYRCITQRKKCRLKFLKK